MYYSVQVEA